MFLLDSMIEKELGSGEQMVARANYLFAFSKNLKIELNKKMKKPTLVKQMIRSQVKANELLTLTGPGYLQK